ncbi:MAG: hypothetical protein OEZ20_03260 [candidate division WOR-3 bacterium]|nr:hypothetical protein [candidate division WOR-3 bacterium]MDH5683464.1 hypothetical protein [candidate division WOR-3 bacterium]
MKNHEQKTLFSLFLIFFLLFSCGVTEENKPITNDELINGNFEQELDTGWQAATQDYAGMNNIKRVKVDKNHYAYLKKIWCGYAQLFQTIKLEDLDQNFSVRARLSARSNREDYSATAAIILSYLDGEDKELAETRIAYSTAEMSDTPTLHIYQAKPSEWQTYSFNLKEELTSHLSKIDTEEIKKLKIALYAFGNQTSGC